MNCVPWHMWKENNKNTLKANAFRRNKNYSGIHVSWINKNLDGEKPPIRLMAEACSIWDGIWPSSSFHHLWWKWTWLTPVKQDKDLAIAPVSYCWFPSKLMPTWELNTRAAFRVFCSWEWKSKAESTVSLFREDGLISWRDIKPEWLLTYNYGALFKLEKKKV